MTSYFLYRKERSFTKSVTFVNYLSSYLFYEIAIKKDTESIQEKNEVL